MKKLAALTAGLCAVLQLAVAGTPAHANPGANTGQAYQATGSVRTVQSVSWVEEWDAETGQWVRVAEDAVQGDARDLPTVTTTIVNGVVVDEQRYTPTSNRAAARYSSPAPIYGSTQMLAQYGPFLVTSPTTASMVGATDSSSPRHFAAMMSDFPQIARLEMIEAPGTSNDIANLAVGRQIREAGIATHVPRGGSVRSGAVELFLAGQTRTIDDGAQFAVHSWLDNYGREADDFAADDPTHRLYLDYYVEMGMSETRAREFYAMTNSVPHETALWLVADDMRYWIRPEASVSPKVEFGDFAGRIAKAALLLEKSAVDARKAPVTDHVLIGYSDLSSTSLADLVEPRPLMRSKPQLALVRLDSQLDSYRAFP